MNALFKNLLCGAAALMLAGAAVAQTKRTFTEVDFSTIQSPNANPFGLVCRGVIIRNEAGKVNIHRITYDLNGQQAKQLPFDLYRDGYEYYLQTHAHPGSTFRYTKSSLVDLMAFDASERMHLTNQPLLMMAGSIADTFCMTEQCFSKATGTNDKELFLIPEATHIQTYWVPEYGDKAVGKLTKFFGKYL